MTDRTAFFDRLVLPDKGTALLGMATETKRIGLVGNAVGDQVVPPGLSVRIMAVCAGHLASLQRMAKRKREFHPLRLMAAVAIFILVRGKQVDDALFGVRQKR